MYSMLLQVSTCSADGREASVGTHMETQERGRGLRKGVLSSRSNVSVEGPGNILGQIIPLPGPQFGYPQKGPLGYNVL